MSNGLFKVNMLQTKPICSLLPQTLSPGAFPSQLMEIPFSVLGPSFSQTPGNPVGSSYKI